DYDAPVAAFLSQQVKPGSLCFDVGANVGVYVLQFAHWSGPTGQVVAFEPNPSACSILQKHVRMNGLVQRVRIVPSAVGEAIVEVHPNVCSSANTTRARTEDLRADLGLCALPLTGQSDPLGDYGLVHLAYA